MDVICSMHDRIVQCNLYQLKIKNDIYDRTVEGNQNPGGSNYGDSVFGSAGDSFLSQNPALKLAMWNNSHREGIPENRQESCEDFINLDVAPPRRPNSSLDDLLKSDVFKKALCPVVAARTITQFGMTRTQFLTVSFEYIISQDVCQILRFRSEVLRSRKHGAGDAAQQRFGPKVIRWWGTRAAELAGDRPQSAST
jgi:hypothetical protein